MKLIIPNSIRTGNTILTAPAINPHIRNKGNNTRKNVIFVMPHVSLIAIMNNLINTTNINVIKASVII